MKNKYILIILLGVLVLESFVIFSGVDARDGDAGNATPRPGNGVGDDNHEHTGAPGQDDYPQPGNAEAIVARQAIRITAIAAQADALIPLFLFLASLNAFWRIFNLQLPHHFLMISANFINIRLCLRAAATYNNLSRRPRPSLQL